MCRDTSRALTPPLLPLSCPYVGSAEFKSLILISIVKKKKNISRKKQNVTGAQDTMCLEPLSRSRRGDIGIEEDMPCQGDVVSGEWQLHVDVMSQVVLDIHVVCLIVNKHQYSIKKQKRNTYLRVETSLKPLLGSLSLCTSLVEMWRSIEMHVCALRHVEEVSVMSYVQLMLGCVSCHVVFEY